MGTTSELWRDALDFVLERFDERRASHRLRLDDLVVQQQLDVVHRRQDVRARVTVRDHHELHLRMRTRKTTT